MGGVAYKSRPRYSKTVLNCMNGIARKPVLVTPGTDQGTVKAINTRVKAALQKAFFPQITGEVDAGTSQKFPVLWNQEWPALARTSEELNLLWENPVKALQKDEVLFLHLPELLGVDLDMRRETADGLYQGEWLMWWKAMKGIPFNRTTASKPSQPPADCVKPALSSATSRGAPKTSPADNSRSLINAAELAELERRYTLAQPVIRAVRRQLCEHSLSDGNGGRLRCREVAVTDGRCTDHLIL